jgi:CheY-like chemotaxis protein
MRNPNDHILLVEDDQVDIMTVKRAFKEIHVSNPLDVAENGEEALSFLNDPASPQPIIILLDLNMPRMNGIEFLRVLRAEEKWRRLPVIVFTTSREERDKVDSFQLGISGYMVKPVDYLKFVEVVRTIDLYWTLSETAKEV